VAAAAGGGLVEGVGVEAGGWLVDTVEEGAGCSCATLLVAAPSVTTADVAGLGALLRLSPALVDDTCIIQADGCARRQHSHCHRGADLHLGMGNSIRSSFSPGFWPRSGLGVACSLVTELTPPGG